MNKGNGMAIASVVLGIVSVGADIFCFASGGVFTAGLTVAAIGLIAGIISVILAMVANKQKKSTIAKVGMICGIVGIVLAVIVFGMGIGQYNNLNAEGAFS